MEEFDKPEFWYVPHPEILKIFTGEVEKPVRIIDIYLDAAVREPYINFLIYEMEDPDIIAFQKRFLGGIDLPANMVGIIRVLRNWGAREKVIKNIIEFR